MQNNIVKEQHFFELTHSEDKFHNVACTVHIFQIIHLKMFSTLCTCAYVLVEHWSKDYARKGEFWIMVMLNVMIRHCFFGCNYCVCRHINVQKHIERSHKLPLLKGSGTKGLFLQRIKIINIKNDSLHKFPKHENNRTSRKHNFAW